MFEERLHSQVVGSGRIRAFIRQEWVTPGREEVVGGLAPTVARPARGNLPRPSVRPACSAHCAGLVTMIIRLHQQLQTDEFGHCVSNPLVRYAEHLTQLGDRHAWATSTCERH